jgi:hypothetical protein
MKVDEETFSFGGIEMSVNLDCCKNPSESELSKIFEENLNPILQLIVGAHRGVKGTVKGSNGERLRNAILKVCVVVQTIKNTA